MSHEIRTPLNGLLGMAQVLAGRSRLTEDQLDRVKVITESGQTLMALLNDVLDISKIEAGKLEIARVDGDLAHDGRIACASCFLSGRQRDRAWTSRSRSILDLPRYDALRSGARAPVHQQPAVERR
jgi:signal transduction histidine kinase